METGSFKLTVGFNPPTLLPCSSFHMGPLKQAVEGIYKRLNIQDSNEQGPRGTCPKAGQGRDWKPLGTDLHLQD